MTFTCSSDSFSKLVRQVIGSAVACCVRDITASASPVSCSATQTDPSDAFVLSREGVEDNAMQDELLLAAAQEFAIYNAKRSLRPGRSMARAVHAPARRIARTLVCLGRQVRGRRGGKEEG
jgi:hypothetical protein